MWPIWLIISGIFFVAEIITTGFLVFWFGVGALFAMIVSIFCDSLFIQALVFVIVSVIFMIFTRPLVNKMISIKETMPTNIYTIIKKEGYIMEDITNPQSPGKVKINGELWSAVSEAPLKRGTKVRVLEVDGVKLKVEPIKSNITSN